MTNVNALYPKLIVFKGGQMSDAVKTYTFKTAIEDLCGGSEWRHANISEHYHIIEMKDAPHPEQFSLFFYNNDDSFAVALHSTDDTDILSQLTLLLQQN